MPDATTDLKAEFDRLVAQWNDETCFLSDPRKIFEHPAHQAIIAMGPTVVPLILESLEREPNWWFGALRQLTGHDPHLAPEDRGRGKNVRLAWLAWGRAMGHLPPLSADPAGPCPKCGGSGLVCHDGGPGLENDKFLPCPANCEKSRERRTENPDHETQQSEPEKT